MDTIIEKPVYMKGFCIDTGSLHIFKGSKKQYDKLIKAGVIETPETVCKRIKEHKEAHK